MELTPFEERILQLVGAGLTYREIGTRLSMNANAVHMTLYRCRIRLGIKTSWELAFRYGVKFGKELA